MEVGYRWVPGSEQILEVGYRWVPGTGQKKNFGTDEYRVPAKKKIWVPMVTGQKKNFGYRWVPGTGKIFTYADP